ncbi:zinc-binding alcohol dehydrogenase family protein [Schlesneria sp.]|uniref:zinc-binding alcohol dehydrogenase family protein n=1 Tax=Schlesneria sp. TaxID=2762018 RepID=UPI002EED3228
MRAIQLEKPLQFRLIDIPEPEAPQADEAVVRVHRIGICGTDLSGYLGKMPFYSYPRIPGHELGVEVVAVGSGVTNVKVGDRCSVEPYMNNPNSFASRRGRPNCCEDLQVLGVHTDGGMRPLFKVPARKLHPSAKLSLEQLALVETLAIGCHAVARCAPQPGEDVLVIGAGPIGLSVIEFVKLTGANLIVMDMVASRLEFCRNRMGVKHTVQAGDGQEETTLRKLTDGHLPTIVIDATGSCKSMSHALNYVGHTGKLVFVGITTENVSFGHPLMHRREMTLLASRNALPEDFGRIIGLIEAGTIDTRPWVTHRTNFDELIAEFPSYTKPETGVIKAIVEVPMS